MTKEINQPGVSKMKKKSGSYMGGGKVMKKRKLQSRKKKMKSGGKTGKARGMGCATRGGKFYKNG
jgi:hypothetical protein